MKKNHLFGNQVESWIADVTLKNTQAGEVSMLTDSPSFQISQICSSRMHSTQTISPPLLMEVWPEDKADLDEILGDNGDETADKL